MIVTFPDGSTREYIVIDTSTYYIDVAAYDGTGEPLDTVTSAQCRDFRILSIDESDRFNIEPVVKTKNRGPVFNRGKGKSRRSYE